MNYFRKGEFFHRRRTNLGLACVPQRQPLMLPPSPLCHQQLCFSGLVSPHQDQNNLGAIYPPNPSPGRLKDSRRILPSLPNAAQRLLSLQPKCLLIHLQEAREHDVMDLNMAFGWMQSVVGWDIWDSSNISLRAKCWEALLGRTPQHAAHSMKDCRSRVGGF